MAFLLISTNTFAEIKTYTYTVKQRFGGSQSPDDAGIAAIAKGKREVLELAGTYLESLTVVRENVVAKDEILALAAGVLNAEIVSQKNYATDDAFGIVIVAKVNVDTSILEDRVKKLLQNRDLLKKYKESQSREKELLARIKELEEQNKILQTLSPKEQGQKEEELRNQFREVTQGLEKSRLQVLKIRFEHQKRMYQRAKSLRQMNLISISDFEEARNELLKLEEQIKLLEK